MWIDKSSKGEARRLAATFAFEQETTDTWKSAASPNNLFQTVRTHLQQKPKNQLDSLLETGSTKQQSVILAVCFACVQLVSVAVPVCVFVKLTQKKKSR